MAPRRGEMRMMPLRLSAASNGLQFSSYSNIYTPPRSIYLQTDTSRPTKQLVSTVVSLTSEPAKRDSYPRRAIASLIPPLYEAKRKINRNLSGRRLASSAASIRSITSTTSSFRSRKRKYYEVAQLTSLPCEILDEIFQHLDQRTLLMLARMNKHIADSAITALYAKPVFYSTYRFAQFVTAVTHNVALAILVKELDLSSIHYSLPDPEEPVAGWREWKYRSSPLGIIRREDAPTLKPTSYKDKDKDESKQLSQVMLPLSLTKKKRKKKSSHPQPLPFLAQYSQTRDVPLGAVLHVLAACPLISKLDLSFTPLAADYVILPASYKVSGFHPTTFTSLLFVSDVPKAYTWQPEETKSIQTGVDLVNAIVSLRRLEILNIRNGIWVSKDIAKRLVTECPKLDVVDFRDCGMHKGNRWAIDGPAEKILAIASDERGSPSPPTV